MSITPIKLSLILLCAGSACRSDPQNASNSDVKGGIGITVEPGQQLILERGQHYLVNDGTVVSGEIPAPGLGRLILRGFKDDHPSSSAGKAELPRVDMQSLDKAQSFEIPAGNHVIWFEGAVGFKMTVPAGSTVDGTLQFVTQWDAAGASLRYFCSNSAACSICKPGAPEHAPGNTDPYCKMESTGKYDSLFSAVGSCVYPTDCKLPYDDGPIPLFRPSNRKGFPPGSP